MGRRFSGKALAIGLVVLLSGIVGGLALAGSVTEEPREGDDRSPWPVIVDGSQVPDSGAPVDAARRDLADRLGIDVSTIAVVSAEAVDWSDGSLGCPQPDRAYPQVISPGYRIVLSVDGQAYEYHASRTGAPFYCEDPRPPVGG